MKLSLKRLYVILLLFLMLAGPLIDIMNGYLIQVLDYNGNATPGVIIRGGIIFIVLLFFCFKSRSNAKLIFLIGLIIIFIAHLYYVLSGKNNDLFGSIGFYLKIMFPFVGYSAITLIHESKAELSEKFYWKVGFLYGFITAFGILFFTYTGASVSTYAYQAFSSKGLVKAQNDTSILLVVSYALFLYYNYHFQKSNILLLTLISMIYLSTVVLLSTRSSLMGIPAMFLFFYGYISISNKHHLSKKQKMAFVLILLIIFIGAFELIRFWMSHDINWTIDKFEMLSEGEFRAKVPNGIDQIMNFSLPEHLLGAGDVEFPLTENDLVDIYGKFGLLILLMDVTMIMFFMIKVIKRFRNTKSLASLCLLLAMGFYITHGALAGHAYASAPVNNLMMLVYFLIYLPENRKANQVYLRWNTGR